MNLAALFLFLFSVTLTLSPAVRIHTWEANYHWLHWIGFIVWLASFMLLHRHIIRKLPGRDPYLLPFVALLTGWGLLTIWRLDNMFGLRQTIWLSISLLAVGLLVSRPTLMPMLRRYKYLLLVAGLVLTALTFVFGTYPSGIGPRLWLGCCGVYLQPSEPLKLLLIIYLAAYLADRLLVIDNLGELLAPTAIMAGAAVLLLLIQRDLGTTTLIVVLYTLIVYLASGKKRILGVAVGLIVAMSIIGYQLFDVIELRIDAWLDPWQDPSGRSYQIVQSLLAFASGGIFGTGPGLGSPGVVPVSHSDFIAAAIGEETGLVGIIGLAALIGLIAMRGFMIAMNATNNYRRYLATGITVYFSVQSILIIGGNIRLLPLTGVTLPFVSYGGSSLLTALIAVGILLLVSESSESDIVPLMQHHSYLVASSLIMAGLFAVALVAGWWSFGQAEELQTRTDNPRRAISDRFVPRGPIFDRQNRPLVLTEGQAGSYDRTMIYTPLSNTLGYHDPVFGQSGIEASMDAYLRGLEGNPSNRIWTTQLLYSQPPPGLAVRLSLDLDIQQVVDRLMGDHKGAAVLLNASTGEILAMASHPYFDPSRLDQEWSRPDAPLLNRATQGLYPVGSAIGPFTLAKVLSQSASLPGAPPQKLQYHLENDLDCAIPPEDPNSWPQVLRNGCPGALVSISRILSSVQFQDLHRQLGFYDAPEISLPVAAPSLPQTVASAARAAVGQTGLTVTPLQMAIAAASISNQGMRPAARMAMAVNTPQQGWVILRSQQSTQALPSEGVERAIGLLSIEELPIWETLAVAYSGDNQVSWYLGGTLPRWRGSPLALALVLEESLPEEAGEIGRGILRAAVQAE